MRIYETTDSDTPSVFTTSEFVDAATAEAWLARSIENPRKIRRLRVDAIARDILNGSWREGASTIKWTGPSPTAEGSVVGDGQHRLSAVREAQRLSDVQWSDDVSVWDELHAEDPHSDELGDRPIRPVIVVKMEVTWNVPREAIDVVDTGAARLFADVITMRDASLVDVRKLAAIARWSWQWENGNPLGLTFMSPTHSELDRYFSINEKTLLAALGRGKDLQRQRIVGAAVGGAAYARFARIDEERAHQFFDSLVSGSNLASDSPILQLRNRLSSEISSARILKGHKLALMVYAWNAFQAGRPLKSMTLPRIRLTSESFPSPMS